MSATKATGKTKSAKGRAARPNPAPLWDILWAHARTRALHAAAVLGLFDHIAAGKHSVDDIARAAKASKRGVRMLLDALVGLELLSKGEGGYDLTDTARTFLVSSSPASMLGMVRHIDALAEAWVRLPEVVRTGKPAHTVDAEEAGKEFFPALVAALFPPSFGGSTAAREALPAETRSRVKRVLDVAAGSAAWSLAWAVADPEVRVTALDFGPVLEVARRYTDRLGATDRYEFVEGNLRTTKFGSGKYDLVILGHILHSEGAKQSRKLIAKSAKALAPGGTLLVAEFTPNDERTGPLGALLFGLNMLVNTTEGDVFSLAELREWMTEAGLASVEKLDFGPGGPDIIVATKPA